MRSRPRSGSSAPAGRSRLPAVGTGWLPPSDEIATGKICGPVGHVQPPGPGPRGGGARGPRPARGPGRAPRSSSATGTRRSLAAIAILGGTLERLRDRGPQPPAHGDRRGHGAVQARPEGQLGDAPQAQPDPVGADRRARPAAPRLCPDGVREPAAVARARHQPLLRRARDPARRDDPARLHAGEDDRPGRGPGRAAGADAREHRARAWASTPRRACSWRLVEAAGLSRGGRVRDRPARRAPGGRRAAAAARACWRRTRGSPDACRWSPSTPASTMRRRCGTCPW